MRAFVAAFVVAAITAALLTPLVRRFALKVGAVSQPGGRHVHLEAIPRLGGIAILLGFTIPLVGLLFVDSSVAEIFWRESQKAIGLFVGAGAMAVVGVIDDTRGMRALHKLLAQLAVASFAFACGLRIDVVTLPMFGNLAMGVFAFPVTVLWIVGIVNAVNLIDGLDGLAAGIVLFAGITNFVVALISGSVFIAVVMAAMIGAVLGFLFFNFNPAKIFMGDSGSYFLGYSLSSAVLVGSSQKASTAVALLVPCVALGVPIFDTLFTMVRRFLERRPLFSPDRGHIHHRLIDMGLTHRRAVLMIYGVSVIFSVAAIGISLGKSWQIGAAILAASVVFFALVRFAGYFEYVQGRVRQRGRIRSPRAELLRRSLPQVLRASADVPTARELVAVLGEAGQFHQVQLVARARDGEQIEWSPEAAEPRERTELLIARYMVGAESRARSELVFHWPADERDIAPETDILLQMLVDAAETALDRQKSMLAPIPPLQNEHETTPIPEPLLGNRARS